MKKHLIFLLLHIAICDCIVSEQPDPPIPCHKIEDCVVFSQTIKDASCQDGFCVCKSGTETKYCSSVGIVHHSNRSTDKGGSIYSSCKHDQDCQLNNSFCNTTISQCDCKKDYILSTSKKVCLKKAETLDFPCVEDKQCFTFLSNTTCQDGLCSCMFGHHYVKNACFKTIDMGKSCNRSEECAHVIGAVCTDRDVCNCAAGTVINEDKKRCLPVAREILENCTENVQCNETFSNSLCIERSCQCRDQYHFEPIMNRCFMNYRLGENCGNTYDCHQIEDGNVTQKALRCAENKCICAENHEIENDRCVMNAGSRFLVSLFPTFLTVIIYVAFLSQN
ncbi:PREDICTED: prion-like-(Q/N-rich) domain-bearing protein 25 [Habropoda laboriosa]|uniref:prion-like-(Q/N-rich) domain-bearing protein 25 n=1 Tax=Habropoda laboriosa TaxID=597456 RepID=UPI00083DDB08|nr:PREDICTED: prion-like-(Q/N-rich) domain-bearing protein 25 [Habropoda laboriosa]